MEYRQLGKSGLKVSSLTLGTMTFGGAGVFAKVGSVDVAGARRQVEMCRDAGINLIDSADRYSLGLCEEILGEVLHGRRDDFLVATKVRMPMGEGPNMEGLSLQERSAEYELLPLGLDQGLGTLVWSPLAGGLLSGKYRRNVKPSAGARPLSDWGEPPVYDEERLYDMIELLIEIADAHRVSAAQVALAWLLTRPTIASVITGARTDAQLTDNLAAVDLTLTTDQIARLEQASRPCLIYPYWHQQKTASAYFNETDVVLHAPFMPAQRS